MTGATETPSPTGDYQLVRPFSRLTRNQATTIANETFDVQAVQPAIRLATERDDTFRVRSAHGEYILKVAHPDDDPAAINLQTSALEYAARANASLPLQRVIVARDGNKEPRLSGPWGAVRTARLLSYLPGTLLRQASPSPQQLQALGRTQAALATALIGFDHVAADRHLLYDLQHFQELRGLLPLDNSRLSARVFDWYDEVFAERCSELPRQVLHADFGLDNVLISTASPTYVSGILDWGDVVRTWRLADLASGLVSQIPTHGPSNTRTAEMLKGYESVSPLTPLEKNLLPGTVALRLTQRILLAEWLSASAPSNAAYLRRNLNVSYQQLANLEY